MVRSMSSGWDDLERAIDDAAREAFDELYEDLSQEVAEDLRSQGLTSADGIELQLDTDDPDVVIDALRVRRRVNEILAGK